MRQSEAECSSHHLSSIQRRLSWADRYKITRSAANRDVFFIGQISLLAKASDCRMAPLVGAVVLLR
jgi:hypothetical protein